MFFCLDMSVLWLFESKCAMKKMFYLFFLYLNTQVSFHIDLKKSSKSIITNKIVKFQIYLQHFMERKKKNKKK